MMLNAHRNWLIRTPDLAEIRLRMTPDLARFWGPPDYGMSIPSGEWPRISRGSGHPIYYRGTSGEGPYRGNPGGPDPKSEGHNFPTGAASWGQQGALK